MFFHHIPIVKMLTVAKCHRQHPFLATRRNRRRSILATHGPDLKPFLDPAIQ
jgi:hypothetical protein